MGSGREAVQVLEQLRPQFHPDPARVDGALENQFTAGPREIAGAGGASYAIGRGVLQYLAGLAESGGTSLETGCGYSTVVLTNVFATHLSVNPDLASNRLVREFVEQRFGATGLRHVEQSSDQGLPQLVAEECRVELALIDGNHSHPFPILDFHYIDRMLARDGLLLVDNTEIHAVQELTEYLEMEGAYEVERLIGNCAVYRKVAERQFGWKSQAIRRPAGVDAVSQELTRLRMEIVPDLRASLSGAAPLPAEPHPDTVDAASRRRRTVRTPSNPTPGSAKSIVRRASRLLRWYASPSGALAAAALVLLAIGFATPGWWRLVGVAGVLVLALFLPYRFLREQRRTDLLAAALRRDVTRQLHAATRAGREVGRLTELVARANTRIDAIESRLTPSRRFSARPKDPRRAELTLRDATDGLTRSPSGDHTG